MEATSISENAHLLRRWEHHIMPNVSTLNDATTHLLQLRRPFLEDSRRVPDERDARWMRQAWQSLNHKFRSFWGVGLEDLGLGKLPAPARASLLQPQQLVLQERFAKDQHRQLASIEGLVALRMPPPEWLPSSADRVALWEERSGEQRYDDLTGMLLEKTEKAMAKAIQVSEGALDKLLLMDLDHMRTARAAYMGMFPVCSSKTKRSNTPDAPRKMMRSTTNAHSTLKAMIDTARQERLFDEECLTLPELDPPAPDAPPHSSPRSPSAGSSGPRRVEENPWGGSPRTNPTEMPVESRVNRSTAHGEK
jgi:hypothetical protein